MKEINNIETNEPIVDIDIDLSATRKRKIRINGDNSKIVELNLSDITIGDRLEREYKKLRSYVDEVANTSEITNSDSEEAIMALADRLDDIDSKMRECVDAIFDYPVCAVCASDGSMYDPFNGTFRFEYIIDALTKLYENNLNQEFKIMAKRINNKAAKYVKKK